jgi:hypothetical protein
MMMMTMAHSRVVAVVARLVAPPRTMSRPDDVVRARQNTLRDVMLEPELQQIIARALKETADEARRARRGAEVTLSRRHCRESLSRRHCRGVMAEASLPRRHYQGITFETSLVHSTAAKRPVRAASVEQHAGIEQPSARSGTAGI